MPKIPFATSTNMLPTSSPGGHVSRWETGEGFGEGISNLAGIMEKYQAHKDEIIKTRQLTQFDIGLVNRSGELQESILNQKSYDPNWIDNYNATLDGVEKGLLVPDPGESPEVTDKKKLGWDSLRKTLQIAAHKQNDELLGFDAKATLSESHNALSLQVQKGLIPAPIATGMLIKQVDNYSQIGAIDPVFAQDIKNKVPALFEEAQISHDLLLDPKGIGERLIADQTYGPNLTMDQRKGLIGNAHALVSNNMALENHRVAEAKRILTENQDKTYRAEVVNFFTGKMNPNKILVQIGNQQIDDQKGRQLIQDYISTGEKKRTELTDFQKKELERVSYLNYAKLVPFVDKAQVMGDKSGLDTMQGTINDWYRNGQLTDTHAKQLTDSLYKDPKDSKDPINDPRVKDKLGTLEKLHTAGLFGGKNTPEAAIAYSKKHDDLVDWVRANPKATTKDIEDHFEGLIKEEKKGFWMKAINLFSGMPTSPGGQTKTQPMTAQTQTVPVEPKKEGLKLNSIYTDAQGRKAKYLGKDKQGKDQWQMVP